MTLTMPVMVYTDRRGRADQWEPSIRVSWPIRGQGILSSLVTEPKLVTVPLFHHRRTPLSRGCEKLSIYFTGHISLDISVTRSCDGDEVRVVTMKAPSGSLS